MADDFRPADTGFETRRAKKKGQQIMQQGDITIGVKCRCGAVAISLNAVAGRLAARCPSCQQTPQMDGRALMLTERGDGDLTPKEEILIEI